MSARRLGTAYARKLVEEYREASVDLGFIGSQHPEDHDEIMEQYEHAHARLLKYIDRLTRRAAHKE